MLNLKIIVGSTRPGRFSETLIPWVTEALAQHTDIEAEVLDLRDHSLPYYNLAASPKTITDGSYPDPAVQALAQKINEADGFIVITPEYNHGYPAVLKSALDAIYHEWSKKAVGLIGYGSTGGARAVDQLRPVMTELQMMPVSTAVHIFAPWNLREADGSLKADVLDPYTDSLHTMLDQLTWWTAALKTAKAA